jgi:hypothetical protein
MFEGGKESIAHHPHRYKYNDVSEFGRPLG